MIIRTIIMATLFIDNDGDHLRSPIREKLTETHRRRGGGEEEEAPPVAKWTFIIINRRLSD